MAVQETRTLPAPFIESLGKDYAKGLTDLTKTPLQTGQFAPKVAPQHQLQQDAVSLAQTGLGAYQPYLTGQGAYAGTPTDMMGAQDYGAAGDYGAAAAALTGTGSRYRSRFYCFLYVSLPTISYRCDIRLNMIYRHKKDNTELWMLHQESAHWVRAEQAYN